MTGRVFDADGDPMSPSFSYGRGGRLYRYYIAMALQRGGRSSSDDGAIDRVPAADLERFVTEQLCRFAEVARLDDARVRALLRRVELRENATHIVIDAEALFGDDHPDLALEDLQARLGAGERAVREPDDPGAIRIVIPARMQFRGGRTFLEQCGTDAPCASASKRDPRNPLISPFSSILWRGMPGVPLRSRCTHTRG